MTTNGFLVSPTFAKWIIGALVSGGVWVGTIQADISDKVEKVDFAKQQAMITQILISIDDKLGDIKDSVKDLDDRQRDISDDVTELKAKAE